MVDVDVCVDPIVTIGRALSNAPVAVTQAQRDPWRRSGSRRAAPKSRAAFDVALRHISNRFFHVKVTMAMLLESGGTPAASTIVVR